MASLLERGAILPPSAAVSLYATKVCAVDLYINIQDQYANMKILPFFVFGFSTFEVRFPEKSRTSSEMKLIKERFDLNNTEWSFLLQ